MEKFDFENPRRIVPGPLEVSPWEERQIKEANWREEVKLKMMEDLRRRLAPFDQQLEHIHKTMIGQPGPENILKLAQAEEIVYKLREKVKEANNEPISETEQSNKM